MHVSLHFWLLEFAIFYTKRDKWIRPAGLLHRKLKKWRRGLILCFQFPTEQIFDGRNLNDFYSEGISLMADKCVQPEFIDYLKSYIRVPIRRRYDLSDSFFEEGNEVLRLNQTKEQTFDVDNEDFLHMKLTEFGCHIAGCKNMFSSVLEFEKHYNLYHRHNCLECRKRFPTNHLLDIHILESHDVLFKLLAEKQNMYRCLVETCDNIFNDAITRNNHVIKVHKWPSDFRFGLLREKKLLQVSKDDVGACEQNLLIETQTSEELAMETVSSNSYPVNPSVKYVPKIPNNICFGHGVGRGFVRNKPKLPRTSKIKKLYLQQKKIEGMDTSVNIEELRFDDLHDALP